MIVHFEQFAKKRQNRQVADGEKENSRHDSSGMSHVSSSFDKITYSEWPATDLAEFYRVLGALQRSGFDVEFVHGATDEGDLWALFEHRKTNQTVLNISLIDCVYNISNSVTDECVSGASLTEITNKIHNKTQNFQRFGAYSSFGGKSDSVEGARSKAAKNGAVIMHPSACLIAFTATALLLIDLVESSDVEAAETIAAIDASHLTSLTDEDQLLDFLFPNHEKKISNENAENVIQNRGRQESSEGVALSGSGKDIDASLGARGQSQVLNKLQNLAQDIGSMGVLTSVIAMTALMTSDDNWMKTLSKKLEDIKAAQLEGEQSLDDQAGVITTNDLFEDPNGQSDYPNSVVTQQTIAHDEMSQDILSVLPDLASITKDLVSLNLLTSLETAELAQQETANTYNQPVGHSENFSFEGARAAAKAGNENASNGSANFDVDTDVTELPDGGINEIINTVDDEQLASAQLSNSGSYLNLLEIDLLGNFSVNGIVKDPILRVEKDHLDGFLIEYESEIQVLAKNEFENELAGLPELMGLSDRNLYMSKSGDVKNISFTNLADEAEALVYFGGTVVIDNFRPGTDIVLLAGEQPKYESVEVIEQDLHLYIDGMNKIVLTNFFEFDSIA